MINVKILTKESVALEAEAQKVNITTTTGEITVLSGHEALISTISDGKITVVKSNGEILKLAVFYGLAHVENIKGKTNLIIMLESIEDIKEKKEEALKEAKLKAKLALKEKESDFNLESSVLGNINRFKHKK